jgi:YjjG family noncanonical pyrimidine nucleotidase
MTTVERKVMNERNMQTAGGVRKGYKCVLFDLDHTLWDYETNSRETLEELYGTYNLAARGVTDFESFMTSFRTVNLALWDLYDTGRIDTETLRRERFKQVLEPFGAYSEALLVDLNRDYLAICPQKTNLMPHAHEILAYLHGRYALTIVTNGFDEMQHTKMRAAGLHRYFGHVVTSQTAGCKKPARGIFDYALRSNAAVCHEAIMIGDNLVTDMGGARDAAIDHVFFNPEKNSHQAVVTHEITCLSELRQIL